MLWLSESSKDGNTLYYTPSWSHYGRGYVGGPSMRHSQALRRAVQLIGSGRDMFNPGFLDIMPSYIARVVVGYKAPDVNPMTCNIRSIVRRIPLGDDPDPRVTQPSNRGKHRRRRHAVA